MAELSISDEIKTSKQEILLDASITTMKCGHQVDALTLNDLQYVERAADGSVISITPAVDWIVQSRISIDDVLVTVNEATATVTWQGDNEVTLRLDDNAPLAYTDTTQNSYTFTNLSVGEHTVEVKAVRDLRGITKTFTVDMQESFITVTYN